MTRAFFVVVGAALLLTVALSSPLHAFCVCRCVDGRLQPLCTNTIEVPPVCPVRICPPGPATLPPVVAPKLPPAGTSACRQAQICDRHGSCRWRQVCE